MVFLTIAFTDCNGFVLPDCQLLQLIAFDLLVECRQIDVLCVLGAGIDELINQQRARDNQQPEDNLSCGRTQCLRFLQGRSYLNSAILVRGHSSATASSLLQTCGLCHEADL